MNKLLTIGIPTYNRRANLADLLSILAEDLRPFHEKIDVLVLDNHSSDDTATLAREFQAVIPGLRVERNESNIGPDRNIARCFELSRSTYVWIFGDDDLPQENFISLLIELLEKQSPGLVNIKSDWVKKVMDKPRKPLASLRWTIVTAERFAKKVNVWTTFISGIVVDKARLLQAHPEFDPLAYSDTNLVQLGWVFFMIRDGTRLLTIDSVGVIATAGNSGGYSIIKAFGENFCKIAEDVFGKGSRLAKILIGRSLVGFLVSAIWDQRFKTASAGSFSSNPAWQTTHHALKNKWQYWLFVLPVATSWKWPAWTVFRGARLFTKLTRFKDVIEERIW